MKPMPRACAVQRKPVAGGSVGTLKQKTGSLPATQRPSPPSLYVHHLTSWGLIPAQATLHKPCKGRGQGKVPVTSVLDTLLLQGVPWFVLMHNQRDSALSDSQVSIGERLPGAPAYSTNCFHFLHSGIKTKDCMPQHGT